MSELRENEVRNPNPNPQPQPGPDPAWKATLKAEFAENERIRKRPELDLTDPALKSSDPWDHNVVQYHSNYKVTAFGRALARELQKLPEEKQLEFFRKAKGSGKLHRACTEDRYLNDVRKGKSLNLTSDSFWGRSSKEELYNAMESVLSPEQLRSLSEKMRLCKAPDEPGYDGPTSVELCKEKLDELRQREAGNPENLAVLDQAAEQLKIIDPEVRAYFEGFDGSPSVNKDNDYAFSNMILQGQKELGDQYKDVFKSPNPPDSKKGFAFSVGDSRIHGRDLTDGEVQELKNMGSPVSKATADAADTIFGTMKSMDDRYKAEETAVQSLGGKQFHKGQKKDDVAYVPEQGTKYYAFWPLIRAKINLHNAVEAGDMEQIKAASQDYRQIEQKMDVMMGAISDPKMGGGKMFDGNVNSTRDSTPLMPHKYASDYAGHNKLNSLYCLKACCDNFGVDPADMVKDPMNTTAKAYENYKAVSGVNAGPNIGAKLCWGLQSPRRGGAHLVPHANYEMNWTIYMDAPLSRGLAGVAGLEPDEEKRRKYLALASMGGKAAYQEIAREQRRFATMQDVAEGRGRQAEEKRHLLYQNAAVVPADKFDMEKIADAFGDEKNPERWKTDLSVDELTKPENLRNVNWRELAARNESVIRQHDEYRVEGSAYASAFDRNEYLRSAFSVHAQMIKNAPPEVRESEDFKAFEASFKAMPGLATDASTKALLAAGVRSVTEPEYFNTLKTGKTDRVFGRGDSKEYTQMKKDLTAVQDQIRILVDGPKNKAELDKLHDPGFAEKVRQAQDSAFAYARLRKDNGKKTSFSAESGAVRAEEGLETARKLGRLQDELGLRSPAEKMLDEARLELLENRHDKAWLKQHGQEVTAKIIHAKRAIESGIPGEALGKAFAPENWAHEYEKLQSRKEYRAFIKGKGLDLDKIADSVLNDKNSKSFTKMVKAMGATASAAYQKKIVAPNEMKKRKGYFLQNQAMERACELLHIDTNGRDFHRDNPLIQAKAKEVLQDKEFLQVMDYHTKDWKLDDYPEAPGRQLKGSCVFKEARYRQQYELKAAGIAVDHVMGQQLSQMEPEAREKERARQIEKCRADSAFRGVMEKIFHKDRDDDNYAKEIAELDEPDKAEALWKDIYDAMNKKLQQGQPQQDGPAPQPGQKQEQAEGPAQPVF